MKTVVTQKAWALIERPEKRCVYLNKAEFATLERAAKILEALERRVDPHEQADFPSHSETSIGDIATASTYLSAVLREGHHHFIDDKARLRTSSDGPYTWWSPINEEAS